jgi:hypothetical protein
MKEIIAIGAYAVCAVLTFGHVFNNNYTPPVDCGPRPHSAEKPELYEAWRYCTFDYDSVDTFEAGFPAAYAGAAWPLYWAGRIAIAVTR